MFSSLIFPDEIKINLESTEKEESFAELIELAAVKQPQIIREEAFEALCKRENKLSTAISKNIAVPHAICKSIKNTSISIGISKNGIEFEPINPNEKNPTVHIIFQILFEEKDTELHLEILKDILQLVKNPDFVNKIVNAKTSQQAYDLICYYEE